MSKKSSMTLGQAVIAYERARQEVNALAEKRAFLIGCCTLKDGRAVHISDFEICLKVALADLNRICAENYGEGYSYEEILQENHLDGTCCDNCYESYQIKTGPLAEARQRFGHAKRRLSAMGKALIKKEGQP